MIIIKDGRARSVRTAEETQAQIQKDVERLSPAERVALQTVLSELRQGTPLPGEKSLVDVLGEMEYREPPVDMETFVKDPYYLGETCGNIYPKLLEDLVELFSGEYNEAVFGGGIGIGKTFMASIGICRVLYELSCQKNPQASLGLAPGSNIAIVALSVNANLAQKVAYENIISKLQVSPYFKEKFPFELTKKEIRFPNHITLHPLATTDTSALGFNLIAAFLDEANFLDVTKKPDGSLHSEAEAIYDRLKRRIKSRFDRQGKIPGKLFLVSSKQTYDDFTEKLIRESLGDPTVFAIDYAIWDVRPQHFSSKKFSVLCGNADLSSKVLTPEEAIELRAKTPEGTVIIDVPEDFRRDFERNLEEAIRDLGGISTPSVRPFIQRREKIRDAVDPKLSHPFSTECYDMSKGGTFLWDRMVSLKKERAPGRVEFEQLRPILNPRAARAIHIDVGLTRDALGFCMCHISGWKQVVRRTDDGREFTEQAPEYTVDALLRVVPPLGGEVILAEVRHLVYDLIAHGYMVTSVSYDGFQGVDSLQQFSAKGINAQLISVDITPEPYDNLKTALYEDRLKFYNYEPLTKELTQLQEVFKGSRRKIDHPPKRGSGKDVSDALAGAMFALSQLKLTQPVPMLRGVTYNPGDDAWMPEQRQAAMAGNAQAGRVTTLPVPFLTGNSGSGFDDWNDPNDPWGNGNF